MNNLGKTTHTASLLRHKHSRKYYGRFTLRSKQKWVSLDTTVLTVAGFPGATKGNFRTASTVLDVAEHRPDKTRHIPYIGVKAVFDIWK